MVPSFALCACIPSSWKSYVNGRERKLASLQHHQHKQVGGFPRAPGLYLVSDRRATDGTSGEWQRLARYLAAACKQGIAAIQLRERDLADEAIVQLSDYLRPFKRPTTKFILNRRPQLVGRCAADGIQVGSDAINDIVRLRRLMPAGSLIGVSCHSESDVARAADAACDFATLGPLFKTASKPQATNFISANELFRLQTIYCLPIYALGGVGLNEAKQLREFGVRHIACIRAILAANRETDVVARIERLQQVINS